MKNIQLLFSVLVMVCVSFSAFAQPDAKKAYEDSLKQAELKRKSELALEYQAKLNIVNQYSASIDLDIQNKKLIEHRLNLNASSKVIKGQGQYNRNAYFYFDNNEGIAQLKKIIVFTIFNKEVNDYREFVFNENEQLYKVNHMPDMSTPKTAKAFYYEDGKLSIYTKDGGKVYGVDDISGFDEDALKEGVDWLNKAAGYMALFKLIKSIEPSGE